MVENGTKQSNCESCTLILKFHAPKPAALFVVNTTFVNFRPTNGSAPAVFDTTTTYVGAQSFLRRDIHLHCHRNDIYKPQAISFSKNLTLVNVTDDSILRLVRGMRSSEELFVDCCNVAV